MNNTAKRFVPFLWLTRFLHRSKLIGFYWRRVMVNLFHVTYQVRSYVRNEGLQQVCSESLQPGRSLASPTPLFFSTQPWPISSSLHTARGTEEPGTRNWYTSTIARVPQWRARRCTQRTAPYASSGTYHKSTNTILANCYKGLIWSLHNWTTTWCIYLDWFCNPV